MAEVLPTVTVVDYGAGNLFSITQAFRHVGAHVARTARAEEVAGADYLVLPGVGAFGKAMDGLAASGLIPAIREFAGLGRPFIGICLGMQLMFEESEEFGDHAGLGLLKGSVRAIPRNDAVGKTLKIPHIGWNRVLGEGETDWEGTVLAGFPDGFFMYFVHSFAAEAEAPGVRIAHTRHGGHALSAVVQKDNLCGFQGHPEKSGEVGLALLKSFLGLA